MRGRDYRPFVCNLFLWMSNEEYLKEKETFPPDCVLILFYLLQERCPTYLYRDEGINCIILNLNMTF